MNVICSVKVLHLFLYKEFTSCDLDVEINMFKWLTDMFKDDRCECRGCMVTRYGWGYAPCSNAKAIEIRQPPRKR